MRSPIGIRVLFALALTGCLDAPLTSPTPSTAGVGRVTFPLTTRQKVDILFLIDNSNSMDSMQLELKHRFPQFFKPFQDLADKGTYADLHIGVVTSDYGAGTGSAPGCTPSSLSGGGDQGRLIAVGKKASADCRRPLGDNFIRYRFGETSEHNLPDRQGLVETFTCMASVGAAGCGFEHPLESVYAALHNNLAANAGFLRDDAILVVVFLTNEDDASAPPDSDVFDKNHAEYGYESSYPRQTRFAVMCGQPAVFPPYGDSGGPLSNCVPAPNPDGTGPGKMFDVGRYRDFFRLPRVQGGVKDNPADVVLIGIDAPEEPFQVMLSNPGTAQGTPYPSCGPQSDTANPPCVPVLQHSCVNPRNPNFFGDPAVRLNSVIRGVEQSAITSICEDDYSEALEGAARLVVGSLGVACLRDPFPRGADGAPRVDCRVQVLTQALDGSEARTPVPSCQASPGAVPCWRATTDALCQGLSPDQLAFSIDFGSDNGRPVAAPPRSRALLECATAPRAH